MDITNTIQISDACQSPDILEWKKWQEEFVDVVEAKVNQNPSLLDSEMQTYIKRARFQVYNVFRAPHTACMMSQYVGYAIRVFADLERAVFKRRVDLKDYYHNMSELLAMYCDLRVNALLLYKDRVDEARHQFFVMLRQFLANNVDYITNALLRIQRLKVSRLMFENMFKFVEKNANFEKAHTNCVTYCRYILFYRQWKKMYSDIMVLREISARAVERLKPPPNFRKHKLFEMLRPKNSAIPPNLTLFFLTAPINTNLAVDKFFSLDEKYAPAEAPAHDDIYEVVDLTDEVQSPKQEDESLERQQPQQQVQVMNRSISYNRPSDDTYNLTLSFNSMMNIDNNHHQTSTQQIDNINQSTSMQCTTSLSSYLHGNDQQPSWSPITRNIITNTNKDHQESIDAGIFSDRSSGNSPAYEMEVKDVNVITSNASISMTEKVITRVISSSCDKCGHKSSSSIVDVLPPPPASFTQQIQTTKPSIPPPSTQSKTSVIVILDDEEDVEQSHRNVKQVTQPTNVAIEEQTQQNCLQSEVLVPGDSDNDVIIVNNDCDNNQETSIIKIEEVTPPSSQQIDESNISLPIESTTTGQKTNISDDRDATTTTIKSSTATSELTQNLNVDDSTTTIQSSSATSKLTQNVNADDAVINDSNLVQEIDNRTLNIKKTNLKDVGVSTQDIMDSVEETHEQVLSDSSSTQRIKRDNASKVRVMSVVDVTPSACVGNDGISNLQQASSSTTQVAKVLNDAETFTIDKPTVLGIQNDNVADIQSTMNVDVNNENVEEDIDTDMDTQHFVDQMFCSKPIESISNKNKTNKDISDNDNSNNDESHRELSAFLKSPPQSDPFFYGFSNSNTSGGGLLKSLSSNNNSLSSSTSSLFNNNNNNIDHNQCSIHLQNATRLTEEFVSTTRTRDTTFMKNTTNTNKTIKNISFSSSNNNKNASNNHKNTKSILKTSKKSQSTVNENNNSGKKKSVVLSKDSYTRYIHEDEIENENQPIIMKTSHGSIHRKQQYGSSLPQYPEQKKGSIIIAENHYDKPGTVKYNYSASIPTANSIKISRLPVVITTPDDDQCNKSDDDVKYNDEIDDNQVILSKHHHHHHKKDKKKRKRKSSSHGHGHSGGSTSSSSKRSRKSSKNLINDDELSNKSDNKQSEVIIDDELNSKTVLSNYYPKINDNNDEDLTDIPITTNLLNNPLKVSYTSDNNINLMDTLSPDGDIDVDTHLNNSSPYSDNLVIDYDFDETSNEIPLLTMSPSPSPQHQASTALNSTSVLQHSSRTNSPVASTKSVDNNTSTTLKQLPLKKRKMKKDDLLLKEDIDFTCIDEQSSVSFQDLDNHLNLTSTSDYTLQDNTSYPATPMMSIAVLEQLQSMNINQQQQRRTTTNTISVPLPPVHVIPPVAPVPAPTTEENIRRHSRYQDYPEYRHNSSHQHQHQENRRVLRQRSESRDRDPYSKYLHPTCQEPYHQPKDRENGRSLPRRRCRSISETRSESYNFSTKESPSPKRVRFDSFNENSRVTRSRSNDRNCRFEDNSTKQSVREQANARNRVKTNSEEEKQLLYEKLRRKYNILKQVQIILNERNNLSLEAYQKKQMEEASRSNNKILKTQRRIQRRKSVYYDIDSEINTDDITSRDSAEFPNELSNDHRKNRLRSRRNSNVNDTNIGQRRGRSRTRMTLDLTLNNIDSTEKSNDRLTPTNSEHINNDTTPTTTTENMYPSTTYFSTPVRIAEFVECLQASTTTTNSITPKSDEIHVPSIQSSIERLQNSLASPISLPASENTTTDSTFNDTNLNKKKYNSIKSGNLILSNVTKQLVNIFSDVTDNVQDSEDNDDNVQYDQEPEQSLDELSTDLNVERPILRTKGARKLLKDEINRPMRQCRRSSSTSNRIFSTDTSSTRRLRKTEYLKTFRHVTGDLEEDQSTPAMQDDEVTTSTPNTELTPSSSTPLSTEVTTTDTYTTSTPLIDSESKLSWEHYINLSPEKQQVSIVDNNVDDEDESNPIYDQLSTIVKSSDLVKPADDQQIQINSIEEIDKSDKHDKPEILSSPINIAPIEQPIIDNSPLKHSNLNVVSDNKIDDKTEKLEPIVENSTTVVDSISTTNECTSTVPKLLPILSKNDEKKHKRTRKVTFVDKTDNINEILNSKLNDQVKTNNDNKNRKTINHLSPTLDNKIINDEQVVKITEIPNKNKKNNRVKSNKKTVNNNKNRITRIAKETKPITKEIKPILKEIKSITKEIKSSKKDLSSSSKDASSKIRFFDLFEEFDQQKNHLLIPNVRKRRLLSCTTTPTASTPTPSSPLVNKSTVNDEDDDDISLAELKRRNVILVKKNVKHLNNKFNKRAGKSHKNCDINHVCGTSTNATTGTNSSTGAIVLTLDEIETCDISVVSCEEVVGEGTILLNNANAATKSSATTTKPATASTATTTSKVNNVVNDT